MCLVARCDKFHVDIMLWKYNLPFTNRVQFSCDLCEFVSLTCRLSKELKKMCGCVLSQFLFTLGERMKNGALKINHEMC